MARSIVISTLGFGPKSRSLNLREPTEVWVFFFHTSTKLELCVIGSIPIRSTFLYFIGAIAQSVEQKYSLEKKFTN